MKIKRIFVLILVGVFAFSCAGCGAKADNLDELSENLTSYDISLDLDDENMTVKASEVVNYINNTDTILRKVEFHLYPQYFEEGSETAVVSSTKLNSAYPNGMSYAEFEVTRVQVAGAESTVIYSGTDDGILVVNLTNSLMPTERVEISIEFSFTLANCEHRFGYGENTINLANFYPIACVYENGAGFDESGYHSNGDPFYSDMANYHVTLTLNCDYIVANTGEKTSTTSASDTQTITMQAKMVRDFAIVMSKNFETLCATTDNDVTIEYYYFSDEACEKSLQAGVDALNTFSSLFGNYPYTTFSIVETDFIYGGMEYPNLIMISADIDDSDDYMNVIVHETAHQWWYAMVGNDEYTYPWLDEALTEYSTILFYDYNSGYNLNHADMVSACKSNYSLFVTVYEDVLGSVDTSMRAIDEYDTEPEYTYCTYVKGVLMYESLYQLMGEEKFISSLQNYFSLNKYTNATPDDLISAFSSFGGSNINNFFSSWLSGKVVIR